jgi:hypothetical protein
MSRMKGLAGRHAVENLDTADFNQPVTAQRIKAGSFGIENDTSLSVFPSGFHSRIASDRQTPGGFEIFPNPRVLRFFFTPS